MRKNLKTVLHGKKAWVAEHFKTIKNTINCRKTQRTQGGMTYDVKTYN